METLRWGRITSVRRRPFQILNGWGWRMVVRYTSDGPWLARDGAEWKTMTVEERAIEFELLIYERKQ